MTLLSTKGNKKSRLGRNYTLDDLEKNEDFQEISERFLSSVGEQSDDIFEYLRDSDFNLFNGMQRAINSEKFTQQQKDDYKYLRSRFDRADMGSLKQYIELVKDAAVDISTDPTAIAAALLTPVTGGTSFGARQAVATGVNQGLKNIAKSKITPAQTVGIAAAEVGAWTGLDNHFRQNTEINTNMRKLYSKPELVGSTAIGALTGGIFGGLARKNEFFQDRLEKLYTDDGYRKEAGSDLLYNLRKAKDTLLAKTLASPAWILKTDAEFSPTARLLGQKFTSEFDKSLVAKTKRRVGYSYAEDINFRRGNYKLGFDEAVAPIRQVGEVLPEDEQAVITLMRGGEVAGASQAVRQTAENLRLFFDQIKKDAEEVGLDPKYIENYFPRSWNRDAIKSNPEVFKQKLIDNNIVEADKADSVVEGMLNKQNELYSSHSNLLTQARKFENLDDNEFAEFLTNDLVPVTTNYFMNAAKTIEHKKHFLNAGRDVRVIGKTEDENLILFKQDNQSQFVERFINPIDAELRAARKGKGLSAKEKQRIIDVYKSVTGQVDYFDSGLIQGIYDGTKLANAMAYLPLATVSSLSEAFITLGKAPTSSAIKGAQDGITRGHKLFTSEISQLLKEKHNLTDDEVLKEMNSVFLAVDEAMSDVTNRLSGEGLQNEFLQKQARRFYRFNLLIPWTKTVQLASFSTGKDLIQTNLKQLADPKGLSKSKIERLTGELNDLGIDIDKGLTWTKKYGDEVTDQAKSDEFYRNDIIRGAGRFTNGVILQTSREYATVPTFMTNPKVDIFTQFLRYPTVFGNTVLRNFARDTITDTTVNAPKLAAFVLMSTNVAKATNYWRSSPEERERIKDDGTDWRDTLKAYQRVGLLGPLEYPVRITEGISYGQNPLVATTGVGGPVINDIIGLTLYNRGFLETAARKIPLTGTKNIFDRAVGDIMEEYTGFRDPYTPLQKAAKEIDKKILKGFREGADVVTARETEEASLLTRNRLLKFQGGPVSQIDPYTMQEIDYRDQFSVGGVVGEEVIEGPEVPFTKDNAAERVNPFTGEPYQEQMDRLGFSKGQIVMVPPEKKEIDSLKKTIDSMIGSYENKNEYVSKLNNVLSPYHKISFPNSFNLLKRELVNYVYKDEPKLSFQSDVEKRIAEQGKNKLLKVINFKLQNELNLKKEGWNPSKTAAVLKSPFEKVIEVSRVKKNIGGKIASKFISKAYDKSLAQKTQIATTGGTYSKAAKIMEDYQKFNSLDYGSGMQVNQAKQALNADTFEPFPQLDKAEKYGMPDFVRAEDINKKYDFITNFSVLNVLQKADRDKAVKNIGRLLDDNGMAIITVRSKDDVLKASPKAKSKLSDSELITAKGTYQKGFTRKELKEYLNKTLGEDYDVMDLPNKYKMSGVGVIIRKVRKPYNEGGPVRPEYIGKDAYESAILKFAESDLDAQLLREFAWVESKFATDKETFRKDNRSAYQITPIRFQDYTDSLKEDSEVGAGLRRYVSKMEKKYGANYQDIAYDDLNNPEIATLVTRALLKRVPEPIGETKEIRAKQWKKDWNTEEGAGTVEKYLTDLKYLK
jgi:hypothetical protein